MTTRGVRVPMILLLISACGALPPTEQELTTPDVAFYASGAIGDGVCGGSGNHGLQNGVDGTCNGTSSVVNLTDIGGGDGGRNALLAAISEWNDILEEAKDFNVPRLVWTPSGGIPIYFSSPIATSGTDFCGNTTGNGNGSVERINTFKGAFTTCQNFQRGTLTQVLIHELSHVLGLNQQHGGSAARTSSLTVAPTCASNLPTGSGDGNLSNSVCYHEVETIIRARNGTGYVYDPLFYTSPLAFGTNVTPRATSVEAGGTVAFAVSTWSLKPSGSVAQTVNSLEWTSLAPTRVSRVSDGVLKGEQAGVGQPATIVRLTGRQGALPSGSQFWTPFTERGDSITVAVTAPPPPPSFKVDSIWTAQMPVTQAGSHTVYTHVVSAPGQPVSMRWIITDSRTPSVSDTLWGYGHSTIPAFAFESNASYTVTFRARPHWNLIIGLEYTQEIPVCTGQALVGGSDVKTGSQKPGGGSGGPGQNAVGGC